MLHTVSLTCQATDGQFPQEHDVGALQEQEAIVQLGDVQLIPPAFAAVHTQTEQVVLAAVVSDAQHLLLLLLLDSAQFRARLQVQEHFTLHTQHPGIVLSGTQSIIHTHGERIIEHVQTP